jgi:hypothetical protein
MKHLKKLQLNEEVDFSKLNKDAYDAFDFEDFDDTDLAGMSLEISIDELIADAQEAINKTIPENYPMMRKSARIAIKNLWREKIDKWR